MKNKITTKTIAAIIMLVFVVSFYSPISVNANNLTISDLYSNPNQSSYGDQFKFKAAQVLKSGIVQEVVGCTGVTDKVAGWMASVLKYGIGEKAQEKAEKDLRKQLEINCKAGKAASEGGAGAVPVVNDQTSTVKTIFEIIAAGLDTDACLEKVASTDKDLLLQMQKDAEEKKAENLEEQCFNGIAITLAKNQLTSMTRSVMNWANTGYGGNPFFIQNMGVFTGNIEKNILNDSIYQLNNGGAYPYGSDFSKSLIRSFDHTGLGSSSYNLFEDITSDLSYFLTDKDSYISSTNSDGSEKTPLQISQEANDRFANDFSVGGWDGWLALTQRDANNPLGFTIRSSQYIADRVNEQITEKKDEIAQNNGFLSQKECTKWITYDEKTQKPLTNPKYTEWQRQSLGLTSGVTITSIPEQFVTSARKRTQYDQCALDGWKITTPGSLIKEKVTNYLNSPERQLELADTINESLNALFSVLISKLEEGGLSSLSDSVVTTNWTDNINSFSSIDNSTRATSAYGNAYGNFNLTKDLGNTYIHDDVYCLGKWDAENNIAEPDKNNPKCKDFSSLSQRSLYLGVSPISEDEANNQKVPTSNIYYIVSKAGKTKLIENGYNGWEVGDRTFWDGSGWQNWKAKQTSPIKKRGVIQIQKDYVVAAKEILKTLPSIMPKIGELDYCIPGPNPNYKINSSNAQSAYQAWANSIDVGIKDSSGERYGVGIDKKRGDLSYDNWVNIYEDNPNVLEHIKQSYFHIQTIVQFSNICNSEQNKGKIIGGALGGLWGVAIGALVDWYHDDCSGDYFYVNNGNLSVDDNNHLNEKKVLAEKVKDYVNNVQMPAFFESFDKMMNVMYFDNMTKKYKEYENRAVDTTKDLNPSYIPMAESGLDLTKNITYYDEEINDLTDEYNNAISQASTNISKLEIIRDEVSTIIKAAQDRRDTALLEKIKKDKCGTQYANCIDEINVDGNDTNMTFNFIKKATAADKTTCEAQYETCLNTPVSAADKAAYLAKYADCFDEEDNQFYDPEEIMGTSSYGTERCSNGTDDDLDGLVDKKDPDCSSSNTTTTTTYKCEADIGSEYITTNVGGGIVPGTYSTCEQFTNEMSCLKRVYYMEADETNGPNTGVNTYKVFGCAWNNI